MKQRIIPLLMIVTFFLSLAIVSASVDSSNIVTANNTEFNTATPTISVNVSGNCSSYLANLTINGVDVVTGVAVANNTNTNVVATTSTTAGNYVYNVTFHNETCDAGVSDTTASNNLEINARPTITSVTESKNVLLFGNTMTWTNVWVDQNSTATDSVTVYVCKTDSFTVAGCSSEWGHSSAEADNSTAVTYTILSSDLAGTKSYYVYVIDDNNYTVSSSTSGDFLISKPSEDVTLTTTGTTQEPSEGKFPWVILVILGVVGIGAWLALKK